MFEATPQNAGVIRKLADAAIACPIGQIVTYATLSRAAGFAIQQRFYLMLSALTLANKEAGACFVNVRTVGYRRLPGSDTHLVGAASRNKIRRVAHRSSKSITNALHSANDLSNSDRIKAYREQVSLGLLAHLAKDRFLPVVTNEEAALPSYSKTVRASAKRLREHLTEVYG